MKTVAERGVYGQWLVTARMARGFTTQEAALAALLDAGYRISKSVYAEYESGSKRPSKTHLPMLEAFWGPVPVMDLAPQDELVAALTRQSVAIESLVEEMRLARERDQDAAAAMMRAAEVLLSAQPRPGDGASTEPPALRGSGR